MHVLNNCTLFTKYLKHIWSDLAWLIGLTTFTPWFYWFILWRLFSAVDLRYHSKGRDKNTFGLNTINKCTFGTFQKPCSRISHTVIRQELTRPWRLLLCPLIYSRYSELTCEHTYSICCRIHNIFFSRLTPQKIRELTLFWVYTSLLFSFPQ